MGQKLRNLYNALLTIETKGNSTIQMAECLRYLEQLMAEESARKSQEAEEAARKKAELLRDAAQSSAKAEPAVETYA